MEDSGRGSGVFQNPTQSRRGAEATQRTSKAVNSLFFSTLPLRLCDSAVRGLFSCSHLIHAAGQNIAQQRGGVTDHFFSRLPINAGVGHRATVFELGQVGGDWLVAGDQV